MGFNLVSFFPLFCLLVFFFIFQSLSVVYEQKDATLPIFLEKWILSCAARSKLTLKFTELANVLE